MAYKPTNKQFDDELARSGLAEQFSEYDLAKAREDPGFGISAINYKKDYNAARTEEEKAAVHRGMEALRSRSGGYSGGKDGSEYYANQGFSYEQAPEYTDKYSELIATLTKELLGRETFSYDPDSDPLYGSYKKQYTREGQRAMQDTLGQTAAITGGIPSSYAVSAAGQANDYYMSKLADKIPELQQLAYSMYRDEGSDQRANLNMLQALESGDYNKYLGLLGQYNSDRNFNYQTQRDEVSDGRYENEWDYNVGRDEVSDKRYEDETAYDKAQAGTGSGGSSGGGSSGNSGGGTSGGTSGDIYEWLSSSGAKDYGTAYQLLRNAGYSTTDAGRYAKYFEDGWSGSNDEKIAQAAADYYQQNPGIALDSRTLDYWLNDNGYGGETAQLFKAYLEVYGAKYSRG